MSFPNFNLHKDFSVNDQATLPSQSPPSEEDQVFDVD